MTTASDLTDLPSQIATGLAPEALSRFAKYFLSRAPIRDLEEQPIAYWQALIQDVWKFLQNKDPSTPSVSIFNPTPQEHGFTSPHTFVYALIEDMPFVVDSLSLDLLHQGLDIQLTIHTGMLRYQRDHNLFVEQVWEEDEPHAHGKSEALVVMAINRQFDTTSHQELSQSLIAVLEDVQRIVHDWQAMKTRLQTWVLNHQALDLPIEAGLKEEIFDFLNWITNNHFIFLGTLDSQCNRNGQLLIHHESGLGIMADAKRQSQLNLELEERLIAEKVPLTITKWKARSRVHRYAYIDYLVLPEFDATGNIIGQLQILGLFTSLAYHISPKYIPFARQKIATVLERSKLSPISHAGKSLLYILETLPRDDLLQASPEELFDISMGILQMQERQKLRLFMRTDAYGRFISCLIYVPKDRFNTNLRKRMERLLQEALSPLEICFSVHMSDYFLARIHFSIHMDPKLQITYNARALELQMIDIAEVWQDKLKVALAELHPPMEAQRLFQKYKEVFPSNYQKDFQCEDACHDIEYLEKIDKDTPLTPCLYAATNKFNALRFKLFYESHTVALSDVLPLLDHLGCRVLDERTYELNLSQPLMLNDFGICLKHPVNYQLEKIRNHFHQAFERIWLNRMENDGFNELVVLADLNWREISILRSYAKYLKQIGFTYSQTYIEGTLIRSPIIAQHLIALFDARFNPQIKDKQRPLLTSQLNEKIQTLIGEIQNLDEDKIIRRYLSLIHATVRVNAYQAQKPYFSFKFIPSHIPDMPRPLPAYELFVYAPHFEAIHLRMSKVARGGLRWSDRREDFRTEVLGLMKAQSVKNAVIVPSGAKGVFFAKQLESCHGRDAVQAEVTRCYQDFIRSMLEITDNLKDGHIIHPEDVVIHDESDHYLVVAADKGTATFSDIANAISQEKSFWLDDAFASGGSVGYDHKKMGITAKGAWVSVTEHLLKNQIHPDRNPFTVMGIGDMSGDVFGNGMLLSRKIELVAAFNHQHIFIDPYPDTEKSFAERERLFALPRSTWDDYQKEALSEGGAIYSRSAKEIQLPAAFCRRFGLTQERFEPNALIRLLLSLPVDLIWNGGIGTYVKGTEETHESVGDKTNNDTRIDASALKAKVIGEGGNLGLTQLARIEYALHGGSINTDFIDNSAGVNCSDQEVNIKILLNALVKKGELTQRERNALLLEMTPTVAKLVLSNNKAQNLAISIAAERAPNYVEPHHRVLEEFVRLGKLDRELEYLPSRQTLMTRKLNGIGLTRPEISTLLAYAKNIACDEMLQSDLPEDPELLPMLFTAMPPILKERWEEALIQHPLKREIIATQLSNHIINQMGFPFFHRLHDESGASIPSIARAFVLTEQLFPIQNLREELIYLQGEVPSQILHDAHIEIIRLARRATRWFLRNHRNTLDIPSLLASYRPLLQSLFEHLSIQNYGPEQELIETQINEYAHAGMPRALAEKIARIRLWFPILDIAQAAMQLSVSPTQVAHAYFLIGERLEITWVRQQITKHMVESRWDALLREALRDDLDGYQCKIAVNILETSNDLEVAIAQWMDSQSSLLERWSRMLADIKRLSISQFNIYAVAVRELLDLSQMRTDP